jgi:hypothetical protein
MTGTAGGAPGVSWVADGGVVVDDGVSNNLSASYPVDESVVALSYPTGQLSPAG